MKQLVFILFCPILFACNGESKRSIQIGDEIAEGDIDKDSTYNGLIRFYNINNHKPTSQATYRNNILEGKREIFYPTGEVQVSSEYSDGKPTGYTRFYNKAGQLESEQYFYYGLRAGHLANYKNSKPHTYSFSSLENERLFYIEYDSIGAKAISEVQKKFFFFKKKPLQLVDFNKIEAKDEYFIYLPNPPKYKFTYSLCRLDDKYNVLETIHTFDSDNAWETITIDSAQWQQGQTFALKLQINDQFNGADAVAFKKLQ